jgi:hypothetical protein
MKFDKLAKSLGIAYLENLIFDQLGKNSPILYGTLIRKLFIVNRTQQEDCPSLASFFDQTAQFKKGS